MEEKNIKVNILSGIVATINASLLFSLSLFPTSGLEYMAFMTELIFNLFIVFGFGLHIIGIFQDEIDINLIIAHFIGIIACVIFYLNPLIPLKLSICFMTSAILLWIRIRTSNHY